MLSEQTKQKAKWLKKHGSGCSLIELNLPHADLATASLSQAHLASSNLQDSNLNKADLHGAYIYDSNLASSRLVHAHLEGARIICTDLRGALLRGADLTGAMLGGVQLHDADLSGACLVGAHIEQVDLQGANLRNADLTGAKLYHVDLTTAHIAGAIFSGATLKNCTVPPSLEIFGTKGDNKMGMSSTNLFKLMKKVEGLNYWSKNPNDPSGSMETQKGSQKEPLKNQDDLTDQKDLKVPKRTKEEQEDIDLLTEAITNITEDNERLQKENEQLQKAALFGPFKYLFMALLFPFLPILYLAWDKDRQVGNIRHFFSYLGAICLLMVPFAITKAVGNFSEAEFVLNAYYGVLLVGYIACFGFSVLFLELGPLVTKFFKRTKEDKGS